jgi:hypothetical protein
VYCRHGEQTDVIGWLKLGAGCAQGDPEEGKVEGESCRAQGTSPHEVCTHEINKKLQNLASGQRLKMYDN